MNELSLHILDICQNSTKANATLIEILITESTNNNKMIIRIKDNGYGMDEETLKNVSDPFFTTRKERDVGLGISLFKLAAEQANGKLNVYSKVNIGTLINIEFELNHIDRTPIGKIEDTIAILLSYSETCDLYYEHQVDKDKYIFDTKEMKKVLKTKKLTNYDVISWAKNNIKEGIKNIHKEV